MLLSTLFWFSLAVPLGQTLEFQYHNTAQMEQYLHEISKNYSSITHLHSIGQSVEGRELWVLILGQRPKEHRVGIPEFKYVGNMHGNEVVGRVLLLQLIDYLTRNYMSDPFVTKLMNSMRIHILPSMNPDGFESSGRDCMYSQGRFNKNGVDLNRNFPDAFMSNAEQVREKEVEAVMKWLKTELFILSANLHGGAVVASYPYDNSNGGGMQDYNYVWAQCLEITLELSCCKFPPEHELPDLWEANKPALLAYMQQVHLGVKGQVFNSNGAPVQNASVEVEGRKNLCPFKTDHNGEYYRLLLPGNYTITVTYPGYKLLTETVSVPYDLDKFTALTHNFQLEKSASTTILEATEPTCPSPEARHRENYGAALLPSAITALSALTLHTLLL
ncbi:carboxypeptidase M isoform X4 [Hemibagrus wyckioides]|uniref:carboxypeptidase M isoform X4 n=1 Tax=Hemibagrus wyckioides TaxID=337641 RepID=UPI00266C6BDD|nr:carboxypeptidase M isoform X4 [Hemibagrus wyckioides]